MFLHHWRTCLTVYQLSVQFHLAHWTNSCATCYLSPKTWRTKMSSSGGMNTDMSTLTYIEWVSIITLYHVSYVLFRFLISDANVIILFYDQVAPSTWSESSVKVVSFYLTFAIIFLLNQHVHCCALAAGASMDLWSTATSGLWQFCPTSMGTSPPCEWMGQHQVNACASTHCSCVVGLVIGS